MPRHCQLSTAVGVAVAAAARAGGGAVAAPGVAAVDAARLAAAAAAAVAVAALAALAAARGRHLAAAAVAAAVARAARAAAALQDHASRRPTTCRRARRSTTRGKDEYLVTFAEQYLNSDTSALSITVTPYTVASAASSVLSEVLYHPPQPNWNSYVDVDGVLTPSEDATNNRRVLRAVRGCAPRPSTPQRGRRIGCFAAACATGPRPQACRCHRVWGVQGGDGHQLCRLRGERRARDYGGGGPRRAHRARGSGAHALWRAILGDRRRRRRGVRSRAKTARRRTLGRQ